MKWIKRGCWLIAWSVWLLLGYGLYRELPRYPGEPIRRVRLLAGEYAFGFCNQSFELFVGRPNSNEYRLVDVRNGAERGPFSDSEDNHRKLVLNSIFLRQVDDDYNTLWRIWPIKKLHVPDSWNASVVQDFDSRARLHREWSHGGYLSGFFSPDRQYWAYADGHVFGPPRVTWSVLALCQTILALPLVLLWAVLRWRRRRLKNGT